GDLARHERLAAPRRFMVEEDAVHGEDPVGLAIVHGSMVSKHFCGSVRAAGMERSGLVLRRRRGAEHFRAGGLVKPDGGLGVFLVILDGLEDAERAYAGN